MIEKSMFYSEQKIQDYRDIKLKDILIEHLLFKGTRFANGEPTNKYVKPDELVSSALFVYGLKSNATNKAAVKYYAEREARRNGQWHEKWDAICVPDNIWNACDNYNRTHDEELIKSI